MKETEEKFAGQIKDTERQSAAEVEYFAAIDQRYGEIPIKKDEGYGMEPTIKS